MLIDPVTVLLPLMNDRLVKMSWTIVLRSLCLRRKAIERNEKLHRYCARSYFAVFIKIEIPLVSWMILLSVGVEVSVVAVQLLLKEIMNAACKAIGASSRWLLLLACELFPSCFKCLLESDCAAIGSYTGKLC